MHFESSDFNSLDFFGKKPSKINLLFLNPEVINPEITEEGPGILSTLIFSIMTCETNSWPGSETRGVPASEIKETVLPSLRCFNIEEIFFWDEKSL